MLAESAMDLAGDHGREGDLKMAATTQTEGIAMLLRFSFIADRGRRAVTRYLKERGPLGETDLEAVRKAKGLLDFTLTAQQLAVGHVMQGFSPETMRVRDAAYAVASARRPTTDQKFEFSRYLNRISSVLGDLAERKGTSKSEVEEAKEFLTRVRDHFQGRTPSAIEIVNQPEGMVI